VRLPDGALTLNGELVFRDRQHDDDEKHFSGKNWNFNGDDCFKICLNKNNRAINHQKNLYRSFVNNNPTQVRQSGYLDVYTRATMILKTLIRLFSPADGFRGEEFLGQKENRRVE